MNKYLSSHKQAGFSMIEVLMALVVVGLVLTAVASMITNSMETRADARYRQVANEIAKDFIEKCRREQATMKWTDFVSGVYPGSECKNVTSGEVNKLSEVGMIYTLDANTTASAGTPEVFNVDAVVTWSSGRNGGTEEEKLIVQQAFTNRN